MERQISTHAPRAGSDECDKDGNWVGAEFQPTLPLRGATAASGPAAPRLPISTHAPRAGSDSSRHIID